MIEQKDFDTMTQWVHGRISDELKRDIGESELHQAFTALNAVAKDANSTFLIPDLFPGTELKVLYIHDTKAADSKNALEGFNDNLTSGLSSPALTAIGQALAHELGSMGCDMVACKVDGAEVIVFKPEAQSLVLQATGTTLLTRQ